MSTRSPTITPISSMTSSPMAPPKYDDYDDDDYNDEDYNDDSYNNEDSDDNYNDEDDDNYNDDDNAEDVQPAPAAHTITDTVVEIVHMPSKGITAWLDHLNRNRQRNSIFEKLRSLVF